MFLKLLIIFIILFPTQGKTATNAMLCGKRISVVKILQKKFQQNNSFVGIINKKSIVEIFINNDAVWTLLITNSDGVSCFITSGVLWKNVEKKKGN